MSFLAPLYLLAAAAVALPILFHLTQRRPRGEQLFSSLMFLSPSPPKMVRRSRLDQWLLLLLRALALLAIAFAFMRPFFRSTEKTEAGALGRQRLILIDTSASMQRQGLWNRAQAFVEATIDESTPQDLIALYRYDSNFYPIVSFDVIQQTAPPERANLLRKAISELKPGWLPTDLGRGLSVAAETLQAAVNTQNAEESIGGEIVLISDFAGAMNLTQLEDYDWPKSVRVVPRSTIEPPKNNATLTTLSQTENPESSDPSLRLLLTNSDRSEVSQFQLQFLDRNDQPFSTQNTPYQVNAGERRVIRLTDFPAQATSVRLLGDDDPSDNRVFFSIPTKQPTFVWLLQNTTESDESQLGFFVERIPLGSNTLEVLFKRTTPADVVATPDPKEVSLIIADSSIEESVASMLRAYAENGGKVVLALDQPLTDDNQTRITSSLQKLIADETAQVSEASLRDYAMWSRVNFQHPLFAPLADARFNDFTKMRTWRHRKIELSTSDANTLATYDNGAIALQELRLGTGRIWIFAAGWQPAESQLALSTKFVPLMMGIFRQSGEEASWPESLYAGQSLRIIPDASCESPTGKSLVPSSTNTWELLEPGLYELKNGERISALAVNVAPREFELSHMDPDRLEQLGVTTGPLPTASIVQDQRRLMRNHELEKQQQVWRWCILLAISLIVLETIWSTVSTMRTTNTAPT
jgi:hypothetical protein